MILLELTPAELTLLRTLLTQYDDLVNGDDAADPALARLFPDAYRGDPEASAEFARYTRSGLVDHKTANAGAMAATLTDDDGIVGLGDEQAARWLPVLTDLRLIIAQRLGILTDDDPVPTEPLGDVYHWLGGLQQHLIEALEATG